MKTKPITPKDIATEVQNNIPEFVIKSINELIAEKFSAGNARITAPFQIGSDAYLLVTTDGEYRLETTGSMPIHH